jgi:hypothetical protein
VEVKGEPHSKGIKRRQKWVWRFGAYLPKEPPLGMRTTIKEAVFEERVYLGGFFFI